MIQIVSNYFKFVRILFFKSNFEIRDFELFLTKHFPIFFFLAKFIKDIHITHLFSQNAIKNHGRKKPKEKLSTRNNNIFIHKDILSFSKFLLSFVLIHLSSNPFEIINHRVFISFRSRDYLGKPFLSLIFLVKRKWVVTYFPPSSLVLHNFHKQRKNAKKRKPSSSLHRKKNVGPRFKNRFEFQENVQSTPFLPYI